MGLIAMQQWLQDSLDADLAQLDTDGAVLHLFKNNWSPALGDDVTDADECDFSGYSDVTIGAWDASTFSSGKARAEASANPFTFTNSTGAVGNDVYGYYVTDAAGLVLLWAERGATAPYDLNAAGSSIAVNLKYTRGDDPAPD